MPSERSSRLKSASDTSDPPTSSHSTVTGTSVADTSTAASDYGMHSDAADDSSQLSSSSEEPSSDSSSEDEAEEDNSDVEMREHTSPDGTINLLANRGKKPTMKLDQEDLGPDIRTFLKDFLPQLKASNDELEVQRKAGTLKGLEIEGEGAPEDGEHIEMVSRKTMDESWYGIETNGHAGSWTGCP